jgi:hypothetical protein
MDARRIYISWACGRYSHEAAEEVGYAIAAARSACSEAVALPLYDLFVMDGESVEAHAHMRAVKDWGYTLAASYASSGRQKYRLDWGHQAARDGLCLALWSSDLNTFGRMPSVEQRAKQFGVGEEKYRRTRRHVTSTAGMLISEFHGFFTQALKPEGIALTRAG